MRKVAVAHKGADV